MLAITHVYVVKLDILCFKLYIVQRGIDGKTLNTDVEAYRHVHHNS